MDGGWRWQIPLQNRTGNGYIYCDQYCQPDVAEQKLLGYVTDPHADSIRHLSFTAGVGPQSWTKNCVAIGLAAGFIEPLESTSISLIETTIERLLRFSPIALFCKNKLKNTIGSPIWNMCVYVISFNYTTY